MKLKAIIRCSGLLIFKCPGCNENHGVYTDPSNPNPNNGAKWGWNQSMTKPTFSPSILRKGEKFTAKGEEEYRQWFAGEIKEVPNGKFDSVEIICHSFVTDGYIQFLSDCTHHLRDKTVEIPEWED